MLRWVSKVKGKDEGMLKKTKLEGASYISYNQCQLPMKVVKVKVNKDVACGSSGQERL